MYRRFCLCVLLFLSACSTKTVTPVIVSQVEYIQQTPFPIKPKLIDYTRQPIIESVDTNNFKVSDEFVENSVLLKKYTDRIDSWKKTNKVK